MDFIVALFSTAFRQTLLSISHNWPYLLVSIVIAGALKVVVDENKVSAFLNRFRRLGVLSATAAAVSTPLCSCGTTAVVLGMMASTMPWAPIVAFMVSSPLSSPEGIIYGAGFFGWPFAIFYFVASILLGISGGVIAAALQKGGVLKDQFRFVPKVEPAVSSCCSPAVAIPMCGCSGMQANGGGARSQSGPAWPEKEGESNFLMGSRDFLRAALEVSKTILPLFIAFAFLGYLLNGLVPASAVAALFGSGRVYGVPLAATIGLPLYINSEASVPLARALLDSGMSPGAIMAFLIAGSGTSIGAIGGALTIARWRVVGLVVAVLWIGAIAVGYGYNGLLSLGMF